MGSDDLKHVSIAAMEKAIGDAISALSGAPFECTISSIEMENWNGMKMTMTLTEPLTFPDAGGSEQAE